MRRGVVRPTAALRQAFQAAARTQLTSAQEANLSRITSR